jgi:hypothetical protein
MAITPREGSNQSKNLVSCVHMRLISPTCVPSDPTPNIWWPDVDRDAPGRGKVLRFILVNSWHRGSTMRSSWRACSSCSECHHSQWHMITILSTRLTNKKRDARRRSTSNSHGASRTQRPRFERRSGNQLRQIRSMVRHDHRSRLHQRLPNHPG